MSDGNPIRSNTMNISYVPGQSVRDRKWGGKYTGTVVNVEDGSVFVQWHGTCVEDEMDPGDIEPAPDVPQPANNGLRLLEV